MEHQELPYSVRSTGPDIRRRTLTRRGAPYADLVQERFRTLWRWCRDPATRDVATGLLLTVVLVLASYAEANPTQQSDIAAFHQHKIPHMPTAFLLLVLAACIPLVVRHRYPVPVLLISTAAITTYSALGFVNGASLLAPTVALFAVAQLVPTRQALLLAAVTLIALMTSTGAANPFGTTGGGFYLIPALVAAGLFGGIAVSNRRAYVNSIQERADEEAKRRVDEERLRIARELHDIVAHSMATINVQAGVAAHVLDGNPDAAREALAAIRLASKDGLRELRAILNVLRQADEGDPVQPAPGVAQLDALVAGACTAGLPTSLTRSGEPRPLPAAVDLAAYRIVQESLTNAIRHAGPASAIVQLCYDPSALRVEIVDTGRGQPAIANGMTGHGLIGMRERAASVGGTLEAGPGREGGFRVAAILPAVDGESG